MNLKIKLDVDASHVKAGAACHMLPCKIKLNGFCKVSKFFTPYLREKDGILTSSIRGYPLKGQKIAVPDGYTGVIFREHKKFDSDDRELKTTGTFTEFTAWNWDREPSSDDKLVKALQWINVANVLHQPVSEYDSEQTKSPLKQRKRKLSE